MDQVRDEVVPGERWAFDGETTAAFSDMLDRSIPNIEDMRRAVTESAEWLLDRHGVSGGHVVDLGTSRGDALGGLLDRVGIRAEYTGLEVSEPMLQVARERFSGWGSTVRIVEHDLREGYPGGLRPAAAILSVLTLQFVPVNYRQRLLRGVHQGIEPGGGLVLVEKVLGASADLDDLEVALYHDLKARNGYAREAIDRKALALEGVLVPMTAAFNEDLLRQAGFDSVDVIWAWGPFRAWVALREVR